MKLTNKATIRNRMLRAAVLLESEAREYIQEAKNFPDEVDRAKFGSKAAKLFGAAKDIRDTFVDAA